MYSNIPSKPKFIIRGKHTKIILHSKAKKIWFCSPAAYFVAFSQKIISKNFYANVTQIKLTKSVQIWGSSDAGDCYCYQIKQGVFFSIMILFRLWRRVFLQRNEFHRFRKCRALYDCEADNEDELSFEEGDVIVILAEETEDENWMEGLLESDPDRRGLFPSSFVHILTDWPSPLSRDAE